MIDDMDLRGSGSQDARSEASLREAESWVKTPPWKRARSESDTIARPREAGTSSSRETEEGASWLKITKEERSLKKYLKAQTACQHNAKG